MAICGAIVAARAARAGVRFAAAAVCNLRRSGVCWLRHHDERKIAKRPGFVPSFPGSQHHQDYA